MENSIECKVSFSDEKLAKETIVYLMNTGIGHDKYRDDDINYYKLDDIYIIEFKEKPFIFKMLEYNNFTDTKGSINISYIGNQGVSFYISGPDMGDGCILVPMSNINCIHTIKKEQIDEYTKWKNKR